MIRPKPTPKARRADARLAILALTLSISLLLGIGAAAAQASALETASYNLFPVEDSNVFAQLQVISTVDGDTELVLTAQNIDTSRTHRAAIYRGDCGPDREMVLELEPVGSRPNDPFVSITTTDISFDAITERDLFVYLFEGDGIDTPEVFGLDATALACGEVGIGANE